MITSIRIENLRGVRHGELPKLAPLTVLTGPNGCGKSTVLDALLIGASILPGQAVGLAVQRHQACPDGVRWLLTFGAEVARTTVVSEQRTCERTWRYVRFPPPSDETRELAERQRTAPFRLVTSAEREEVSRTYFAADNFYIFKEISKTIAERSWIKLIDPGSPVPLDQQFSEAIRQGNQPEIEGFLRPLVADMDSLAI